MLHSVRMSWTAAADPSLRHEADPLDDPYDGH